MASVATQEAAAEWLQTWRRWRRRRRRLSGWRSRAEAEYGARGSLRAGRKREGVVVEKELDLEEARRRRWRHRLQSAIGYGVCPPLEKEAHLAPAGFQGASGAIDRRHRQAPGSLRYADAGSGVEEKRCAGACACASGAH